MYVKKQKRTKENVLFIAKTQNYNFMFRYFNKITFLSYFTALFSFHHISLTLTIVFIHPSPTIVSASLHRVLIIVGIFYFEQNAEEENRVLSKSFKLLLFHTIRNHEYWISMRWRFFSVRYFIFITFICTFIHFKFI